MIAEATPLSSIISMLCNFVDAEYKFKRKSLAAHLTLHTKVKYYSIWANKKIVNTKVNKKARQPTKYVSSARFSPKPFSLWCVYYLRYITPNAGVYAQMNCSLAGHFHALPPTGNQIPSQLPQNQRYTTWTA